MAKLKQKTNGIYYLDVRVPDGTGGLKRSRVGLDTKDKDEAETQRRDWLAGVHPKHPAMGGSVAPKGAARAHDGSGTSNTGSPYLSTFLARCLNEDEVWANCRATATHQSNVRILSGYLPDLRVNEVTSAVVKDLHERLKEKYAPASARKLLGSLSAACRFAVEEGLLDALPKIPSITVDNRQDRVVQLDEEKAAFECIAARSEAEPDRAWVAFGDFLTMLLDTACRKTEMMLAGPSWVKRKRWIDPITRDECEGIWLSIPAKTMYEGRQITVTKNGKPRDVPLTKRCLDLLPSLQEGAKDGRWFPWAKGSGGPNYYLGNLREDMAQRGFQFGDVKLHTMRHTCATRLAEGGLDLVGLRDWLGHGDIKITASRYLHLMNSHIYRGAAILEVSTSFGDSQGDAVSHENNRTMREGQLNGTNSPKAGTVGVT